MTFSPTKHRPLSRQPSSPSLAVGLPPPIPEYNIMTPSSSSRSLKRSRSRQRVHRGDVSSSAASSPYHTEDEDEARSISQQGEGSRETTPKRRVVNIIEPVTTGRSKHGSKKQTLQERLAAVAKVKKSRSISDGLVDNAIPPVPSLPSSHSKFKVSALPSSSSIAEGIVSDTKVKNDKVVVCVRMKPTTSPFSQTAYEVSSTSLTLSDSHPNVQKRGGKAGREDEYTYTFDKLLQYPSTTPDLYSSKVAPLVIKAMNGFNSTIFAYGQTGSGKSFTMTGTDSELGIIPCAVDGVFDAINAEPDRAFLLRVSYIEIYNETLRDLLNFKKSPLKEDERPVIHTSKGKVYVEPLVEEVVSSPQDIVTLLAKGNHGRKIGATDWNERSSRSHCVFTIVIESRPRDGESGDDIRLSRLNLIDLAGSEKAVSDMERRGEGKHINKSLLALREVINKLTDKKRMHVPYRDSKLTHLLENALGGDSNICVICTLSAEEEHCAETLETLKFAGRCSQVETQAKKNVLLSDDRALIKAKDKEIDILKRRLRSLAEGSAASTATADSSEQITDLAESVAAMEARKGKLHAQLAKLNNEILTSEILPRSTTGFPMSPPKPKRRRISELHTIGLGSPRTVVSDRRAVSGMIRVTEEVAMPSLMSTLESGDLTKSFEHDRMIASLKRALTLKEEELLSANRELSQAIARLAHLPEREADIKRLQTSLEDIQGQHAALQLSHDETIASNEIKMREWHVQLESTRAELVSTVNNKAAKIDQLENAILELRKSREDLVMEDQERYDGLKAELGKVVSEREVLVKDHEAIRSALEDEKRSRAAREREIVDIKRWNDGEVGGLRSEIARLASQNPDFEAAISSANARAVQLEASNTALQSELEMANGVKLKLEQDLLALQSERELADRGRKKAEADLEAFQKAAMASEATAITELREEVKRLKEEKERETEASRRELETMKQALEEEKRLRAQRVSDLDATRASLAEAETRESAHRQAKASDEERIQSLLAEIENLKAKLAGVLEEEKQKLQCVQSELESERARVAELQRRETELRQSHGDASAREQQLLSELDQLRGASAQALEKEKLRLGTSTQQAETLAKQVETLTLRIVESEERQRELEQLHATSTQGLDVERRRAEEATKHAEALTKQVQALTERVAEGEKREQETSRTVAEVSRARDELAQQVATTESNMSTNLTEEKARFDKLQKQLATEKTKLAEAEKREATLLQASGDVSAREKDLRETISRLEATITQRLADLAKFNGTLNQEKGARRVAEAHVKSSEMAANQQVEKIAGLEIDCNALRQAVDALQRELDVARESVSTSTETATSLAKEVAELKAAASLPSSSSVSSLRARHTVSASDPTIPSNHVMEHLRSQALTSASTGEHGYSAAGKLMTKEREEIERLEKVVEAQKVIIDEQREKIMMWAKEIEQQREIVRALTESVNTSSPTHHGRRVSHGKSKSSGVYDSPRPAAATKKPFPSTFTAFNLALPTTPTPLPMHPSQFDNTSGKRGRRVTIDHDMNKLSESSKVNRARAMFEQGDDTPVSPTKTPVKTHTRAHSTMMASAPRQRRP